MVIDSFHIFATVINIINVTLERTVYDIKTLNKNI